MALRGTLETFSVPEVLRLLSNTAKTGLLALDGDRGSGKVWMSDGVLVGARSDHEGAGDIDATLFDLLRFSAGEFVFEADTTPDEPTSDHIDVEEALGRAEALLLEWREIETVIPSLFVGLRLAGELSGDSVTLTAEQWRALAAIGGGTSVAGLGQRLDLGELDTCRRVRDLVEESLIELTDDCHADDLPADDLADDLDDDLDDEPTLVDHDLSQDEVATLSSNLASFVAHPGDPAIDHDDDVIDVQDHAGIEEAVGEMPINGDAPAADPDDTGSPDEFLAQLTNLSPKAAAAIEATAEEAAPAPGAAVRPTAVPEGDEEINRNLLLKFLSSTKH